MAYVPEIFVDHSVEFPNRRKLTAVSGQADTFDVARAEGTVFATGTKPDAANLNAEFGKIKTETDAINTSLTAPTVGMFIYDYQNGKAGYNTESDRGADTFHPFNSLYGLEFVVPTTCTLQNMGWNGYAIQTTTENAIPILTLAFSSKKIRFIVLNGSFNLSDPTFYIEAKDTSTQQWITLKTFGNHGFTDALSLSKNTPEIAVLDGVVEYDAVRFRSRSNKTSGHVVQINSINVFY